MFLKNCVITFCILTALTPKNMEAFSLKSLRTKLSTLYNDSHSKKKPIVKRKRIHTRSTNDTNSFDNIIDLMHEQDKSEIKNLIHKYGLTILTTQIATCGLLIYFSNRDEFG